MIGVRLRSAVLVPLLASLLIGYFAFYTFLGDRSLLRMMPLEVQIQLTQSELNSVKAEHDVLENRVTHMRPASLDPDLLAESSVTFKDLFTKEVSYNFEKIKEISLNYFRQVCYMVIMPNDSRQKEIRIVLDALSKSHLETLTKAFEDKIAIHSS